MGRSGGFHREAYAAAQGEGEGLIHPSLVEFVLVVSIECTTFLQGLHSGNGIHSVAGYDSPPLLLSHLRVCVYLALVPSRSLRGASMWVATSLS